MLRTFITLTFIFIASSCFSRKLVEVDTVRYRFSFTAELAMYDKPLLLPDEVTVDIGDRVTHCYSRWDQGNKFLRDSIYRAGGTFEDYQESDKRYPACNFYERDIKNYPKKGVVTVSDDFRKCYIFEEPIEEKKWQLLDGDTIILGYPCKKASCDFRGRKWNVWYSLNIPISEGPWKLDGLPGMILKAEDSSFRFRFECIGVKDKVNIPMVCDFGTPLKTTAKKVYELRKLQYTNYTAYTKAIGLYNKLPAEGKAMLESFHKTEPFLMEYYDK